MLAPSLFFKDMPLWNEPFIQTTLQKITRTEPSTEKEAAQLYLQIFGEYAAQLQSYQQHSLLNNDQRKYIVGVYEDTVRFLREKGFCTEARALKRALRGIPFFTEAKKMQALESLVRDEVREAKDTVWEKEKQGEGSCIYHGNLRNFTVALLETRDPTKNPHFAYTLRITAGDTTYEDAGLFAWELAPTIKAAHHSTYQYQESAAYPFSDDESFS